MDLKTTAYTVSLIALALNTLYKPFEIYDAMEAQDRRKVAIKLLGLLVSCALVVFMLMNPPR